jgi:hypothetical protein
LSLFWEDHRENPEDEDEVGAAEEKSRGPGARWLGREDEKGLGM